MSGSPPFDLIIFDYDGVIADSEILNNQALSEMLTAHGLPTTVDEALEAYMGKRWRDCAPVIREKLGRDLPDEMLVDWTARCEAAAETTLQPVAGVQDFVAACDGPMCVASSSPPEWLALGLHRFGLAEAFGDRLYSAAVHVERGKPHPDLFLHAAREMGADPARTLVLEDSTAGVQAGVAAGMTVVAVCAGGHIRPGHPERLMAAGAHHRIDDYAALAGWLRSEPDV